MEETRERFGYTFTKGGAGASSDADTTDSQYLKVLETFKDFYETNPIYKEAVLDIKEAGKKTPQEICTVLRNKSDDQGLMLPIDEYAAKLEPKQEHKYGNNSIEIKNQWHEEFLKDVEHYRPRIYSWFVHDDTTTNLRREQIFNFYKSTVAVGLKLEHRRDYIEPLIEKMNMEDNP